jgi:AcrR family transcriptional regulator
LEDGGLSDAVSKSGSLVRRSLLRQERSRETRRALVRTAARLWSERGFDDVTVEEICSAAGVGRTTFYLHFENKDQLLHSLAGATADGVASDLDSLPLTSTLEDRLDAFIVGVSRRMEAVPKSLAELVIRSQRVQLAKLRAEGTLGDSTRFADLVRETLLIAQGRREMVEAADPAELGEILGAVTMDAIETWASSRFECRGLEPVLRSRFDVVLTQYKARRQPQRPKIETNRPRGASA